MQILGFAHISLCFSLQQKSLLNMVFEKSLDYERIKNNTTKFQFMESKDYYHFISLDIPNFEICLYESTSSISIETIYQILSSFITDEKGNLHLDYFPDRELSQFLSVFGGSAIDGTILRVKSFPFMRSISFNKMSSHSRSFVTNSFLDSPGVVSLAFYTDSTLTPKDCERLNLVFYDSFPVQLRERSFFVQILKIGMVNVELISRP